MKLISYVALSVCVMAIAACQGNPGKPENAVENIAADGMDASAADRTIHAVMLEKIIPSSDKIWNSVGETFEGDKLVKLAPSSDAEWRALAQAADAIVSGADELQASNLPVAGPGVKILNEDEEGALSALQVEKLINANRPGFVEFAGGLAAVARDLQGAIKARDADRISELGGDMDAACEACHMVYWYPPRK